MKRDMDLIRKILIAIEDKYIDSAIYDLEIDGYNLKTIAYHCKILFDGRLISDYEPLYGDGEIMGFAVGSLTWNGHEFLDKIKSATIWNKTKKVIEQKGLPMVLDVVKEIASFIACEMTKAALKGMI